MISKVCDIYPIKSSLWFYNSFAKSIISYGILIYLSAAKDQRYKIENAQRRILRAIFFSEISMILLHIFLKKTQV